MANSSSGLTEPSYRPPSHVHADASKKTALAESAGNSGKRTPANICVPKPVNGCRPGAIPKHQLMSSSTSMPSRSTHLAGPISAEAFAAQHGYGHSALTSTSHPYQQQDSSRLPPMQSEAMLRRCPASSSLQTDGCQKPWESQMSSSQTSYGQLGLVNGKATFQPTLSVQTDGVTSSSLHEIGEIPDAPSHSGNIVHRPLAQHHPRYSLKSSWQGQPAMNAGSSGHTLPSIRTVRQPEAAHPGLIGPAQRQFHDHRPRENLEAEANPSSRQQSTSLPLKKSTSMAALARDAAETVHHQRLQQRPVSGVIAPAPQVMSRGQQSPAHWPAGIKPAHAEQQCLLDLPSVERIRCPRSNMRRCVV